MPTAVGKKDQTLAFLAFIIQGRVINLASGAGLALFCVLSPGVAGYVAETHP